MDAETLLLPGADIPEGAEEGDVLSVFVYLDSEDRPVATVREEPKVRCSARSRVPDRDGARRRFRGVRRLGAAPKELLVPFGEQTRALAIGDRHPVGIYVDDTGRLAGTMRVTVRCCRSRVVFAEDEWVSGEAWRSDPGPPDVFVIVEQRFVGLLPSSEPHRLSRGDVAKFRVSNVLPDGKIELSLRGAAHEELAKDAAHILAVLQQPGTPLVGDRSDPQQIRDVFGLSKKAFKRATGRLLRLGDVSVDARWISSPQAHAPLARAECHVARRPPLCDAPRASSVPSLHPQVPLHDEAHEASRVLLLRHTGGIHDGMRAV